jgi:hypothetical protein
MLGKRELDDTDRVAPDWEHPRKRRAPVGYDLRDDQQKVMALMNEAAERTWAHLNNRQHTTKTNVDVSQAELELLTRRLADMSFLDSSSLDNNQYLTPFFMKACQLWTFGVRFSLFRVTKRGGVH